MTIVEFVENVCRIKLDGWQKELLEKMYDLHTKNPERFNHNYIMQKEHELCLITKKEVMKIFDIYEKGAYDAKR